MPTPLGIVASQRTAPPVSGFDPLTIPWLNALWAQDPAWTPPANGATVAAWRNAGTNALDAVQTVEARKPVYRTAWSGLSNKPAVEWTAGLSALTISQVAFAQPHHYVWVGWLDPTHAASPTLLDGSTNRNLTRNLGTGFNITMFAGSTRATTGGGINGPFILLALYNGTFTGVARMNGTAYSLPASPGSSQMAGVSMFIGCDNAGASSNNFKGALAFFGHFRGTLDAGQIADLETWAKSYYGTP